VKKRYKILIAVLLILLTVFSFLIFKYHRLIKAVWDGFTLSAEKIETMQDENDKKTAEIAGKLGVEKVRPLTEEEEKELANGNITKEEAINIILGNKTIDEIKEEKENTNADSSKNNQQKNPEKATQVNKAGTKDDKELKEANERISSLIGEIYVLKARFKNELKGVEGWVESEYRKLTKEEKAPKQSPAERAIGQQMFSKVAALESECDSNMKSILSEMKMLLQKTGQDTKIVDQIRDAYENEKQITKASYINRYR
jgi:hypothetical protein